MARRESVRAFLLIVGLFVLVALLTTVGGILDDIQRPLDRVMSPLLVAARYCPVSTASESETAHEGVIAVGEIRNMDGPAGLEPPTLKFVHYPGSQQLILWLPKPAHEGYGELSVTRDGADVERGPVSSRMNGSVQILFATLEWPPGDYRIAIAHKDGWRHEVALKKYAPGAEPPPPKPVVEAPSNGPIVYRDGFGNLIPDTDLVIRGQAGCDIARMFGRRLEYEGNYRAGTITYIEGDTRIRFLHEMAGGDVKFSIEIPSAEHWEGFTKTPRSARDDIIAFLAERVRIEKANSWRYRITSESIDYYEM